MKANLIRGIAELRQYLGRGSGELAMSFLPAQFISLGIINANVAIGYASHLDSMPSSVTVANWTTALATVLLVVGALLTAIYARRTYITQSEHSRRAQAESVFVRVLELAESGYRVSAINMGNQRIYDLGVTVSGQGATLNYESVLPDTVSDLMPGEEIQLPREAPIKLAGFNPGEVSATLRFRDAAGSRWQVTDRGQLTELA
jgi:hypothetical protein